MAIRVTNAKTCHGRYYAAGEIIDSPTSRELSAARLYGWETVVAPKPLDKLNKPELLQLALDRGLEVDGLTKKELVDLLA